MLAQSPRARYCHVLHCRLLWQQCVLSGWIFRKSLGWRDLPQIAAVWRRLCCSKSWRMIGRGWWHFCSEPKTEEWAEREERQRRNLIQHTAFLLFSTLSLAQYVLGDVSGNSVKACRGQRLPSLLILAGIASELSSRMVQFGSFIMLRRATASAIIYMIEVYAKYAQRHDTEEDET